MTEQPGTPPTPPTPRNRIANALGAAIALITGTTTLIAITCAAIWTCRHLIAWALA